ncbi:hypothetical protein MRX96_049848 [Rhipicephalus microplus]
MHRRNSATAARKKPRTHAPRRTPNRTTAPRGSVLPSPTAQCWRWWWALGAGEQATHLLSARKLAPCEDVRPRRRARRVSGRRRRRGVEDHETYAPGCGCIRDTGVEGVCARPETDHTVGNVRGASGLSRWSV